MSSTIQHLLTCFAMLIDTMLSCNTRSTTKIQNQMSKQPRKPLNC